MQSRTRQPWPPGVAQTRRRGLLLSPGRRFSSQPRRAGLSHPPGTGHIWHRAAPSPIAAGRCWAPLGGSFPAPGQPRTLPALRQLTPLGMPMGTQLSLTYPEASSGMGWAWFPRVGIISKLALDSHSRAREQIRDLTLAVFPNCGTHARHSHCYFNVSWMHVAALHKPFCTHAPPRPQTTFLPALGVSRAKTASHRKWKSQF